MNTYEYVSGEQLTKTEIKRRLKKMMVKFNDEVDEKGYFNKKYNEAIQSSQNRQWIEEELRNDKKERRILLQRRITDSEQIKEQHQMIPNTNPSQEENEKQFKIKVSTVKIKPRKNHKNFPAKNLPQKEEAVPVFSFGRDDSQNFGRDPFLQNLQQKKQGKTRRTIAGAYEFEENSKFNNSISEGSSLNRIEFAKPQNLRRKSVGFYENRNANTSKGNNKQYKLNIYNNILSNSKNYPKNNQQSSQPPQLRRMLTMPSTETAPNISNKRLKEEDFFENLQSHQDSKNKNFDLEISPIKINETYIVDITPEKKDEIRRHPKEFNKEMLYTYKYSKLDLSCFNYLLEGLGICGIGLGVYYAFKKSDKILDLIKKYIPEEPGLQFKEFIERVLSPFKDLISLISNPKKLFFDVILGSFKAIIKGIFWDHIWLTFVIIAIFLFCYVLYNNYREKQIAKEIFEDILETLRNIQENSDEESTPKKYFEKGILEKDIIRKYSELYDYDEEIFIKRIFPKLQIFRRNSEIRKCEYPGTRQIMWQLGK